METHESPDPYRYESPDRYGTEALTHMGHARNHNALAYHKMFTAQVLTVFTAGPPRPLVHETPRGARSMSPQNRITASDGDSCTRRETDRKTEGERQIDGPYATKTAHSQTR